MRPTPSPERAGHYVLEDREPVYQIVALRNHANPAAQLAEGVPARVSDLDAI
jgi:hypothetical protein